MPIAMLPRAGSLLACLAIWVALPQAEVRAGTITFNDLSDVLTVADTTGRITSSVCTTTIADESCFVTVSAPANTVAVSEVPAGLNVREPGGGPLSDVLVFFNFSSTSGTIQFVSDVEGGAVLDPVPGPFIDETGAVQEAASVTWTLADGSTVIDTIRFVSDVSEIPEPASGALLGAGIILGVIGSKRRRPLP